MKRFRDGGALAGQVVDLSQYYLDLRNGTLPAVSYIVTTNSSENPPAGPNAGSRTLRKVTTELMKSSAWSTSAMMWTYDGWGGWYDHVPPPKVDSRGYGFRVPALLVSPYAKKGEVDHTVLDYTSMLRFIETNWKLAPLSTRDKQSAGLASAFDFTAAPRPPASLPWTWPAPVVRAATNSPAPVIYSIYGVAAALAIAIVGLAILRRGPITFPLSLARAGILARSSLKSVGERTERFVRGSRHSPSSPAALASTPAGDIAAGPVPFSDVGRASLRVPNSPRAGSAGSGKYRLGAWYRGKMQIPTESSNGHAPSAIAAIRDAEPGTPSDRGVARGPWTGEHSRIPSGCNRRNRRARRHRNAIGSRSSSSRVSHSRTPSDPCCWPKASRSRVGLY